jgi:hypothetical protein
MALDSDNRPHVVTFKLPAPRKPDTLRHDPPSAIRKDLRFVHYWRADDGTWRGGDPIATGVEHGGVARGDMVFDGQDTLYFCYADRTNGNFRCLEARAADGWQRWRSYPLTDSDVTGRDASKHDRLRWAADGVLSFTARFGGRGFGIVDLRLEED